MDKLKPCPFCGSPDVDAEGWWKWWNGEWITGPACNACGGAAGSISQSPADNRAAWNTRTDSALAERVRVLEEAANSLVKALDLCQPAIDNAFGLQAIHGWDYKGPTYGKELDALKTLLAQPAQSGDKEKGKEGIC